MPVSVSELWLMQRVDEIYTAWPFYGSRKIAQELKKEGHGVNRKHVQRIMRRLGLASNQPGPNTSKPHPEHIKFPYLLNDLFLIGPLEVWSTDITYIRLPQGVVYLVAVDRLVQSPGAFLPPVQQPGDEFLPGSLRRSNRMLWPTQNLQYRPGRAIYLPGVRQRRATEKYSLQNGRAWSRLGQHFRRTSMEIREI